MTSIISSDTGEGAARNLFQSQFPLHPPPWGSQSPCVIWGDVAEVVLTFPGLRALTDEAASCRLSLDTHPTSGSVCSAWNAVKVSVT